MRACAQAALSATRGCHGARGTTERGDGRGAGQGNDGVGALVAALSAADGHRDLLGGQFDRRPRRARPCAAGGAVLLALDACARAADAARLAISEARLAGAAGALADRAAARRAGYRGVQHPALYRLADADGAQSDADPVGTAGAHTAGWEMERVRVGRRGV